MANLDGQFKIDVAKCKSNPKYVFKGEKYRITFLSDVLIRFEYNESGTFCDYPTLRVKNRNFSEPNVNIKTDDKYLIAENSYFKLEYTKNKSFYGSKVMPDTNLRVTLSGTDKIWYFGHPEVRNLMGSAYSLDNSKGKAALKKGIFSLDGFYSLDDSKSLIFAEDGSVHKNPNDGIDVYLFIYKKDYGVALKSYYDLTGYPPMIPRYALGIWWNKNERYTEPELIRVISGFKKSEIPLSVILLNNNWHTEESKTGFTFNTKLFKNPTKFIESLHNNKIYLGINLNFEEGINSNEASYSELQSIVKTNDNKPIPFNVYNTDFINVLMKSIINPLLDMGVDFFGVNDYSKDLTRLYLLNHYIYTNYGKDMSKRGMTFTRNPGISSHMYPVHYSGETLVNWKTLKMLPQYNALSSNIGMSWWSHDIGGYKNGIEDSELYMRYVQMGVYSPIFRLSSASGRYYKREPWKWDVKTFKVVKDYMITRHKLIPYIYSEAYKYHKTGSPLIQPLYYRFPELIDEPSYRNEYFFGSELLVSPITDAKDAIMNRVVHRLFLPGGSWYDFKTGKKFPGGKRYVTFYKDEDYPVFAKSGAIIVMGGIDTNNINNSASPESLEIHLFPGRNNKYQVYEDDGVSSSYKIKNHFLTEINYDISDEGYEVKLSPISGQKGIVPLQRNYTFKFRNTRVPDKVSVSVDGNIVPFAVQKDENDYIIKINKVSSLSKIQIKCVGESLEIEALRVINEDLDSIISDLMIETDLKVKLANIIFSDHPIKKKRIEIKRLKRDGLPTVFIKMFLRLLEYIADI